MTVYSTSLGSGIDFWGLVYENLLQVGERKQPKEEASKRKNEKKREEKEEGKKDTRK